MVGRPVDAVVSADTYDQPKRILNVIPRLLANSEWISVNASALETVTSA